MVHKFKSRYVIIEKNICSPHFELFDMFTKHFPNYFIPILSGKTILYFFKSKSVTYQLLKSEWDSGKICCGWLNNSSFLSKILEQLLWKKTRISTPWTNRTKHILLDLSFDFDDSGFLMFRISLKYQKCVLKLKSAKEAIAIGGNIEQFLQSAVLYYSLDRLLCSF